MGVPTSVRCVAVLVALTATAFLSPGLARGATVADVTGSIDGGDTSRSFINYQAAGGEANDLTMTLSDRSTLAVFQDSGNVILPYTHGLVSDPVDELPDFLSTLLGQGGCSTEGCSDPTAETLESCLFRITDARCHGYPFGFMNFDLGDGNDSATMVGGLPLLLGEIPIWMDGGQGADQLAGGSGLDAVFGGQGADIIHGNGRNDELGGDGDSTTSPGGNDHVYGGAGADLIIGGMGSDHLYGQGGDDTIRAQDGRADIVDCGDGNDTVYADAADTLVGCEVVHL